MINNCSANYTSVWGIIIWPNSTAKIFCWFSFQTFMDDNFSSTECCLTVLGHHWSVSQHSCAKSMMTNSLFVLNIETCFIICYGWQFQFDKMLFDKGCCIIIGQVVNTPFGKVCTNCEIFISVAMFELIWNGQMR